MSEGPMVTVTVCVGSSCHIKGAREVIVQFNDLLARHGLTDRVELKGCFCMERCGEGINWQVDEEPLASPNAQAAVAMFMDRVVIPVQRGER